MAVVKTLAQQRITCFVFCLSDAHNEGPNEHTGYPPPVRLRRLSEDQYLRRRTLPVLGQSARPHTVPTRGSAGAGGEQERVSRAHHLCRVDSRHVSPAFRRSVERPLHAALGPAPPFRSAG